MTDVLDHVRQFRGHVTEPSRSQQAEARLRLLTGSATSSTSRPEWRLVRPLSLALAGASIVATLVGGLVWLPGAGPGVDRATAGTLLDASQAAAAQPATPAMTQGQFTYVATSYTQPARDGEPAHSGTREMWIAIDGSGRILDRDDTTFDPGGLTFGTNLALTYADVVALPRDPDELYAQVERAARDVGNGRPLEAQMFVLVTDVLREPATPVDVRAALYAVAARIPGVELVGQVTDSLGRPGIAVALAASDNGIRSEFVFDPATGAPLAERETASSDGSLLYESTIISAGIVDGLDARPSAGR